ncbi:L-lactate dehydrogenase A [Smittium culicis]|uniref:L-lactate dehydrogenase n=1 Tax=Smittium culicis TaxID=133412 RepID=A0A1R1Y8R5_9FUNG|nr:L-lactate dehydrogenase A [Smittium culicis]OMJ23225.1 L-lactate dehydrogenase A [Smittium culicis]
MQEPLEILLVDVSEKLAEGQALDIRDAAHLSPASCRMGHFDEVGSSDVIIVTAGARQNPGEPRSNLVDRNYKIMESIFGSIGTIKPSCVVLMVSNPVDILTHIAQKITGLPKNQVIGSGTFLDSGRLRNKLSQILNMSPSSIHANMLGEHGDTQFVGWSLATVAGAPLLSSPLMQNADLEEIEKTIANQAYEIIEAKGSTYYGVGYHVATLAKSIIDNGRKVYPICNYIEKYDTYLSFPAVLGSNGATPVELNLSKDELAKLEACAKNTKAICDKYD